MTGRSLRLLHVSTGGLWRGRERQALALAEGLAADGHAVTLAAPAGSELDRRARTAGLRVEEAGLLALRRLLKPGGWDVIHLNDTGSLRRLRWARAGLARPQAPCVVAVRGDVGYGDRASRSRRALSGATQLWAVSEWVWSALVSAGVDEDRIAVIHTGVDLSRFTMPPQERLERGRAARERLGLGPGDFVVGTVQCLLAGRGMEDLIEAARRIRDGDVPPGEPSIRLLIIGSGPGAQGLAREAAARGMEREVLLTGEREDIPDLMAAFDCYVHPSNEPGAFPVALREAMALALPVVATDVMGIREILDNGRHGLIAPVGDPEGLARNILRMRRDSALASACGRLACLKAQRYGSAVRVDRAEELYLRLIR